MLPKNEEIKALFTLIDDPDEEVYSTISNRLLDYGTPIIPDLENLWENTLEETTLERIEKMIYRLRLKDIHQQLTDWAALPKPSLFEGALILVKYQFPEMALDPLRHQLEKIRRNMKMEFWYSIVSYVLIIAVFLEGENKMLCLVTTEFPCEIAKSAVILFVPAYCKKTSTGNLFL